MSYKNKPLKGWIEGLLLFFCLVISSCSEDSTDEQPQKQHTEAVNSLITICDENPEIRALLEHAISQAATINPDHRYNPAQSLDEFYDFVDWNVRCLPWDVMTCQAPGEYGSSLYGRTDQGVGYFWFIVDQPLEELEGRGFYYPTVEFVEPFASWLTTYATSWGEWLSTEESWNETYYTLVKDDPDWGLSKGWYGEGNQWKTFNEFFSRSLVSPDVRPIADAEVVSPADSWPKEIWHIDENNQLTYPSEVQIKTAKLSDIAQLIGYDSKYCYDFAGGSLTHTFLDVNDYHRYHSPVDGTIRELRNIPGVAAGGGYTMWDDESKLYYYSNDMGFQMVETRSCAIIETEQYGLVAMLPVGMSQICSCNWLPTLNVGQHIDRGQEMGYFLFGGSDIIMIFQKGINVELAHDGDHLLMGEAYARLSRLY
jgi:phosphatidylserine decarboxylase precursor